MLEKGGGGGGVREGVMKLNEPGRSKIRPKDFLAAGETRKPTLRPTAGVTDGTSDIHGCSA